VLLFSLAACDRSSSAPPAPAKTVEDYFDVHLGDHVVHLQIAVREAEMARGLMERTTIGHDDGMLFVYTRPQRMSFWMHDTPTALDIGFFNADGVLEEIYPLHPFDETTVSSRGSELIMALEMNQGWYHENGVVPGARLDLKAVLAALDARGFKADDFKLRK